VTDTTDGGPIFITGGETEALDGQTVRIVVWTDLPTTGERRIVSRIAAAASVAIQINLKMQQLSPMSSISCNRNSKQKHD
jgi:adenylylsulfate kinase-like enzyme